MQKPYWARLNQIDLSRCIAFTMRSHSRDISTDTDEELDALLEREHNTDLKAHYGELPFWRLAVLHEEGTLQQFVVSFVFHHGIADTMSGLAFHRSFLDALLRAHNDKRDGDKARASTPCLVQPPNTPLLPPLETVHTLPLSWRFIFRELKSALFSSPKPGSWTGHPVPTSFENQRSRLRSFSLLSNVTNQTHAACQKHKVTITSPLQVLITNALFVAIPQKYTVLSVEGAISFRRSLQSDRITQDSIGCYVGGYRETHRRDTATDVPWPEARRVRRNIEVELAKDGKDTLVAMSRFIFNYTSFFNSMRGRPRESSLEFSNVGRFVSVNQPEKSDSARWSISKIVFSHNADVTGAAVLCSAVTGEDGKLSLGFAWAEGGVDEGIIQKLMEGTRNSWNVLFVPRRDVGPFYKGTASKSSATSVKPVTDKKQAIDAELELLSKIEARCMFSLRSSWIEQHRNYSPRQ
ncbi:alcohol acetyltransferase [Lophiotrema nucula]|uniref:Alcohol acetyltransferase n=1 Tax=Lophiotrema nucula TaxID=690887 RepID=A0A6A5ZSZ2_9PLEO|nr:alcohol acetyltransferase [Lophiotrema nucula]